MTVSKEGVGKCKQCKKNRNLVRVIKDGEYIVCSFCGSIIETIKEPKPPINEENNDELQKS